MCSFCLLWLLGTTPVRNALTASLEKQTSAYAWQQTLPQDTAIVLLGSGTHEQAPDEYGQSNLTRAGMMRTAYAARMAKHTGLTIYATGGSPLREGVESESSVMRRWLRRLGIPDSQIIEETKANTTWENAVFTRALLQRQGIKHVILITSAWHMPRAKWCFERQGLHIIPAPTDYLTHTIPYDIRSFIPKWSRFADSGTILHEYLGLLWYKLTY